MASEQSLAPYGVDRKAEMTATPSQIFDELEKPGDPDLYMDDKEMRRVLRRLDLHIVPYASLLYLLSL